MHGLFSEVIMNISMPSKLGLLVDFLCASVTKMIVMHSVTHAVMYPLIT